MDATMPAGDGVETVRSIRDQYPQAQVLVLTGQAPEWLRRAETTGAVGIVSENISVAGLASAIRAVHWRDGVIRRDVPGPLAYETAEATSVGNIASPYVAPASH